MSAHNEFGKWGEDMAVAFLEKNDYAVRHRNWRFRHLEVDIIAVKGTEIIFIEVKTRRNDEFGDPIDAVDEKKMKNILHAADTYIKLYQIDNPIRFDIIAVTGDENDYKVEQIKDAFYPTMTKSI
jgi:putative endonuclease